MMEKKDINTLIADFLWGNATEEDLQDLKSKLEADPQLKAKFDKLVSGKTLAARYRQYAAVGEPKQPRARFATLMRRVLPYAAAAVLLIAVGIFWYSRYTEVVSPVVSEEVHMAMAQSAQADRQEAQMEPVISSSHDEQTVTKTLTEKYNITDENVVEQMLEAKRITTRRDKEFWLTLPDGTLVHLNYNTRVIYPEQFTEDTRDVILDGEAYFMVAKDRRHPFVVHTPQGEVKDYGTEFNVSTRGESGTEVVLVDGKVGVTPVNGTEHLLKPGQKCTVTKSQCAIADIDVEPYIAWNTGKFTFEDCALEKLMDVIGRWYNMEVEFKDDSSRHILFTGILSRYADISSSLKAIETVANVDIQTNEKQIIIYP